MLLFTKEMDSSIVRCKYPNLYPKEQIYYDEIFRYKDMLFRRLDWNFPFPIGTHDWDQHRSWWGS